MQTGRLAILNGFGRSLGDSIMGLQALHAAQALSGMPRPVLLREDHGRAMVNQIYALAHDLADVAPMPADAAAHGFGRVIDLRDFAFDPAFRRVAMIDYFLQHLGLHPGEVPATLRRNTWLGARLAPMRPEGLPDRYVLVCPDSSMKLRDLPDHLHDAIIDRLFEGQRAAVVTQRAVARPGVRVAAPMTDLAGLCGLVAGAVAIVSTDTAMVHLADAFQVPCLALFTTHDPVWRVRDYPLCRSYRAAVAGLPDALEFSRGPSDLAAIDTAWRRQTDCAIASLDAFIGALPTNAAGRVARG